MKNKIRIILIGIIIILLGVLVVLYFDYKSKQNNLLDGYYKLEKVITYYKLGNMDTETEVTNFINDKKLYINNNKIESKIVNTTNYHCLIEDNKLYYNLEKIKTSDNIPYFEFEKNDEYLILINANRITEAYYYKKIQKEEY